MEIKNGSRVICVLGMLLVVLAVVALPAHGRDAKFFGYAYEYVDKMNTVDDGTWVQVYINDNYHPEYNTTTATDDLGNHGYYEVTISSSILRCGYIISFRIQDKNGGWGSVNWTWSCSNTLVPLDDIICYGNNSDSSQNEPPICTCSIMPSSGYVPLMVTFYLTASDSDGTIMSWTLDINNDGTLEHSGSGNPPMTQQHTYTTPGTYTATFTVTDNQSATNSDTRIITVSQVPLENQSPTCSLTASSTSSGTAPLTVTFTMVASDPDGSIATWTLDLNNDGTLDHSGPGAPPSTQQHIYQTPGTYTATFTVTDNKGTTDSDTMVITVSQAPPQNQAPIAHFTFSSDKLLVTFTDESMDTDGDIIAWHWDFGDQQYSNTSNTTHEYEKEGEYTVSLAVTDNDGDTNKYEVWITVKEDKGNTPGFGIAVIIGAMILSTLVLKRELYRSRF